MKRFLEYQPKQAFLLPPSPLDWLPSDHLSRFILDVADELDLSRIYAHYQRELRGRPPYDPRMMVSLLVYGYCIGVPSSRKLERRCVEDVAFRVLTGNQQPDHTSISEFRRIHLDALAGLFVQVLRMCQELGLVKLGHIALDGTKMKGNASKHKAMSYERMQKEEERLREKVQELLRQAADVDAEEDALHGKGRRGDELPAELARAEGRREKIRDARRALEAAARERQAADAAKTERGDGDDDPPPTGGTPLPSHNVPRTSTGEPTPKAQRNFTDPESRIMKTGDGFIQGYNAQTAVDAEHQIILAQAVTNQPPDVEHFIPMLEQVFENCDGRPAATSADAGYLSEANMVWAENQGINPHLATGRRKHNEPPPVVRGRPRKDTTMRDDMARKLATKKGAAVYARRKVIVEPPFGQIKNRGFRSFLLRGLAKVRGEWSLISMSHNLLKLHVARYAAQ